VSTADRARWDARHSAAGPGRPAPPGVLAGAPELVDAFPRAGRALDVACGRGGVAVWLALRGLAVDAVDVSPVGLAAGVGLAAVSGVDLHSTGGSPPRSVASATGSAGVGRIRWIVHDLDDGLPEACTGPYDVVVCQLFRPARYGDLAAVLAPGGLLALSVLSEVGAGPGPFRAAPGELRAAFPALSVLLSHERDGEAALLARAPDPAPHGGPPAPPARRPARRPPSSPGPRR
jgi:SAM-dependent methyltransferase